MRFPRLPKPTWHVLAKRRPENEKIWRANVRKLTSPSFKCVSAKSNEDSTRIKGDAVRKLQNGL